MSWNMKLNNNFEIINVFINNDQWKIGPLYLLSWHISYKNHVSFIIHLVWLEVE